MTQTASHDSKMLTRGPALEARLQKIINFLLWPTVALGSIAFIEPSPYDLFLIPLMIVWFFAEMKLHYIIMTLFFIEILRLFTELFALWDYFNDPDAFSYVLTTIVVTVICLFSALLFSFHTARRVKIFLDAYVVSCLVASVFAFVGYFDIGGAAETFAPVGRALGSFKDPNVMGSYCVLGSLSALQLLLLDRNRNILYPVVSFMIINLAILLTFSRGSLGALILTIGMLVAFSFATSDSAAQRGRIMVVTLCMAGLVVLGLLALLSNSEFAQFLSDRTALVQEYDGGETGRFGNQIRSIPMLLDRLLNGFGPLQFRKIFNLEPHNSFVGGFANAGLLGGFSFFALVMTTTFVGFRLCIVASPFRRPAQVMWPALLGYFLQSFQIDTDHWRFMYMLLGAVWGLEAGRMTWVNQQARLAYAAAATLPRPSISR